MKTTISVPDALFETAESLAERQGVSRSELYARAVAVCRAMHRHEELSERLNQVYADEPSGVEPSLREVGPLGRLENRIVGRGS